jgi:hypothetical protein
MNTRQPLIKSPNQVPFRYGTGFGWGSARAFRRLGNGFVDQPHFVYVAAYRPGYPSDSFGMPTKGETP